MSNNVKIKSLDWSRRHFEDGIEFIAPVMHLDCNNSDGVIEMRYSIYEPLDKKPETFLLFLGLNAENFEIGNYENLNDATKEAEKHHKKLVMLISSMPGVIRF